MSPKRARWQVGDVFSFPVDEAGDRVAFGQIVGPWGAGGGSHFYFAIFDAVYPNGVDVDIAAAVEKPVALLGLSMDALLRHGRWRVQGQCRVPEDALRWPAYKEGTSPPGVFDVVDHTGQRRRRASDAEIEKLPYREVVAPIRLENAFRALHGEGEWNEAYASLLPVTEDATAARLLPS